MKVVAISEYVQAISIFGRLDQEFGQLIKKIKSHADAGTQSVPGRQTALNLGKEVPCDLILRKNVLVYLRQGQRE